MFVFSLTKIKRCIIHLLLILCSCSINAKSSIVSTETQEERGFIGDTSSIESNCYNNVYGIRWSLNDEHDIGERCFGAIGLSAKIGIGSVNGQSDFDNIYPWSQIKRCNIRTNLNGARIVTYEGEPGFSLDGANGDVFVRVPRFNISRYKMDGYEYRVIGDFNSPVHEAFLENGHILDEIFISAFEGYLENGVLYSRAGVIPTSNLIGESFLLGAKAKGKQYTLYDNRCVDAIWTLMIVEYGKRNTNKIIGHGLSDFQQPVLENSIIETQLKTNTIKATLEGGSDLMPVGSTITICRETQENIIAQRTITNITRNDNCYEISFDGEPIDVSTDCFVGSGALKTNLCESVSAGALTWHTGRADWNQAQETRNPIRYRWIENLVGNLWQLLPDVTFVDGQMYYCANMEDYCFGKHDGITYLPVGEPFVENNNNGVKDDLKGVNYWITDLADETFAKPVLFGRHYDKNLTSNDSFGAYYYLNTNGIFFIANGGGFDHLYRCNMLTNRAWIRTSTQWYLYGARIVFKNIN